MVHKSKLTQTAGVLFALTLMTGFARPASAAYGPLQPLACGEAKSNLETYHAGLANYIGIGGTQFIVNATSTIGEGKAGYVMTAKSTDLCELLDDRENEAIEIHFKPAGGSINQATVRFHFKPHLGLSDIITIVKPLKDFNVRDLHHAAPGWKVASLPAKAIWAGHRWRR